jgi:hypothetical protein
MGNPYPNLQLVTSHSTGSSILINPDGLQIRLYGSYVLVEESK